MRKRSQLLAAGVTACFISNAAMAQCDSDINGDGITDGVDLTNLLSSWGSCPGNCPSDLDRDGQVGGADLTLLLTGWGECEEVVSPGTGK